MAKKNAAPTKSQIVAAVAAKTDLSKKQVNAVLEALALYENVSIISRPKIAVREGGRAEIVSLESIPFYNITGLTEPDPSSLDLVRQAVEELGYGG